MSVLRDECIGFCLDLFQSSSAIPHEESILALDGDIGRIIYRFTVDHVVDMLPTACEISLIVGIIDDILLTDTDREVREEVSPGRCCHVDMDEFPMVIVQMDTVLRMDSGCDIAAGDFFHVARSAEVTLYPIDIYGEVRMMMGYVRTRCCDVGDTTGECESEECEEYFYHSGVVLVDRLYHDLETSDREPDHSDETRLQYTKKI